MIDPVLAPDPNATTQHGPAPAAYAIGPSTVAANRTRVESQLADALHEQAVFFLERARELRKGKPFDVGAVQEELYGYLGADLSLLGQLAAYEGLEHPGTAGRARAVPRGVR